MKMLRILSTLGVVLALFAFPLTAQAATVVVKVNGQAVTDVQVTERLALMKLEHRTGQKVAIDELIDEALKDQEATRLGFTVTEADIDTAFQQVAQNLKVSTSNLQKVLTDSGVGLQTLRDRLKASLSWSKVTGSVVSAKVQFSEADIDAQAKAKLNDINSFDYILKEVVFLMPDGQGNASQRTAQANQYRKAYTGCANAVQESLTYTDAAVHDLGRRNAGQFPDAIAQELAALNVGGITKPRVVQGGVSMIAVCSKEATQDTTYIAAQLRQTVGSGALQTEATKYLADLKAKAQIVYG
jgi:peptidyl-prolyl cis-trans isomerase SurA